MSPFAINLEKAKTETSLLLIEPALNAFGSMLLISKSEDEPGIHEWVTKTSAQMSPEERSRHKLVTIGFHYSILPTKAGMTFEAYLEGLEATPPSEFRDRLLKAYSQICITEESQMKQPESVDWDTVLLSAQNYVDFLRYRFGDELTDVEIETRAYQYVIDPVALKQLVTSHIRWFWKNYLQAEWNRVRPMLEESARAFNQLDLSNMTGSELVNFVTGKEINESKWHGEVFDKPLVFIP